MFRSVLIALPLLAAIVAAHVRNLFLLRVVAVAVIAISFTLGAGGLIAPHRLAEERIPRKQQSADWDRGARDTRDVVYSFTPLLVSSFVGALLLALRPVRVVPKE